MPECSTHDRSCRSVSDPFTTGFHEKAGRCQGYMVRSFTASPLPGCRVSRLRPRMSVGPFRIARPGFHSHSLSEPRLSARCLLGSFCVPVLPAVSRSLRRHEAWRRSTLPWAQSPGPGFDPSLSACHILESSGRRNRPPAQKRGRCRRPSQERDAYGLSVLSLSDPWVTQPIVRERPASGHTPLG